MRFERWKVFAFATCAVMAGLHGQVAYAETGTANTVATQATSSSVEEAGTNEARPSATDLAGEAASSGKATADPATAAKSPATAAKPAAKAKKGWVSEGGRKYFYNADGTKKTGEFLEGGKWYYLDPSHGGAMATGRVKLPYGKIVYYGENGAMLYGMQDISGVGRVYLDPVTGALAQGERLLSGKWYYFKPGSGAAAVGITRLPAGKTVYYGKDGAMLYGSQVVPNIGQRYFDPVTGALKTGIATIGNKTYYIKSDAKALTGELQQQGKWYYFDPADGGARATGFRTIPDSYYKSGSKTVYYGTDGAMRYGEQRIQGKWYFFDSRGAMARGLTKLPYGKVVYYGADGAMRYGLQDLPNLGERYFNTYDGALITNAWAPVASNKRVWVNANGSFSSIYAKADGSKKLILVDKDGNALSGWQSVGGSKFYASRNGELATGMKSIGGSWYYFDPQTHEMAKGERRISGKWYFFASDGKRASGVTWIDAGKKWVFYDLKTGQMRYGEQRLSYDAAHNGWYHFDEVTGAMTHGFYYNRSLSKWVYYDCVTGIMHHGLTAINGSWYLLNYVTGAVTYGLSWVPDWGAWKYFDLVSGKQTNSVNWWEPSGKNRPSLRGIPNLNIEVSIANQQVYVKSGGRVVYAMVASTGMLNGRDNTPLGWYRITGRGYSFYNSSEGMGARYYTQFLGDYLFHSVPTDARGNYMASEGAKLGRPASHGCVRLTVSDAQWFYNELPNGTSIWIH